MGSCFTRLSKFIGWCIGLFRRSGPNNDDESRQHLLEDPTGSTDNPSLSFINEIQINEKRCRELVAEGKCSTVAKARIGVTLMQMGYEESRSIALANRCRSVEEAILLLQNECKFCTDIYDETEMFTMLFCVHKCCIGCAKKYFSSRIREGSIRDVVCPFCRQPDLSDISFLGEYFGYMSHYLESILEKEVCEVLERKLRDVVLDENPDTRRCPKCDFCCFIEPGGRRLSCRKCGTAFCTNCKKEWQSQHDGFSCEQFANWKAINDPEFHADGLKKYLDENGIDCPNCKSRFDLSKGGCMHFKCPICKHEFCSGCKRQFKQGNECEISDNCKNLGLHSHHPRNCLFYLRDYDMRDLEDLLMRNSIALKGIRRKAGKRKFQKLKGFPEECHVLMQKETEDGLKDKICGAAVVNSKNEKCRVHYIEYLTNLVLKHNLDPVSIMKVDDLAMELVRNQIAVPEPRFDEKESAFRMRLISHVKHEIPL